MTLSQAGARMPLMLTNVRHDINLVDASVCAIVRDDVSLHHQRLFVLTLNYRI